MPFLAAIGAKLMWVLHKNEFLFAIIVILSLLGSIQLAWQTGDWMLVVRDGGTKLFMADDRVAANVNQMLLPDNQLLVWKGYVYLDMIGNLIVIYFFLKGIKWLIDKTTIEGVSAGHWMWSFIIFGLVQLFILGSVLSFTGQFNIMNMEGSWRVVPYKGLWSLVMNWQVLFYPFWGIIGSPAIQSRVNESIEPLIGAITNNTTVSPGTQSITDVVFIPAG